MFGPQTATGGRIRSSIFFFLSRAFWKIEGWSSSDRSPPAILPASSTKFTIESPGEEGTRGVMERALATGETWREGRRVYLGLVCINFRYGTTSCRIVSLSLSSSRVRRVQSGSVSLSPFLSQWGTRNESHKQYRPKMEKHQKKKKQPRVLSFRPAAVSGRRQGKARSMECLKLPINFLKASHCERLHLHPLHQRERREDGEKSSGRSTWWGSTSFRHIFVLCHNLIAYSHSIPTKNHAHSIKISRSDDPFVLSAHP